MNYYEVIPATSKYHGLGGLTYGSGSMLAAGQIVSFEIRGLLATGFVISSVPKPNFRVLPIINVFNNLILPGTSLALFSWMHEYYPGPIGALASQFLPSNLLSVSKDTPKTPGALSTRLKLPELSKEQTEAIKRINSSQANSYLLHGETGSGKTRVYLELAMHAITSKRSAVILTPEIALTPQLVNSFTEIFGNQVEVTHSVLTPVQRKLLWLRLLNSKQPSILIGPRSALFMPMRNLGLIVIDEFHDQAYKQENTPYYQALRVASKAAAINSAKLVLGSATPSVQEYFIARQKQIPILRMTTKPAILRASHIPTEIRVADLSNPREKTKHPLITTTLIQEIKACLSRGEQAMIFLNKRGSARSVVCQTCGWQALCPRCDLALVYHADTHMLYCHTCGFRQQTPSSCPSCASAEILFNSPGTKAVAGYLQALFPDATIARFDKDNKKSERLEARHGDIKDGSIDILVGTQLLTKGHDLTNLSLVGILLAETGLAFPDYTAEEHSYQIIRQLLGRVGRGHRPGFAVVQSFDPNNNTIKSALSGSWEDFYNNQLSERKTFGFPPYYHVMKIRTVRSSRASAKSAVEKLSQLIAKEHKNIIVVGPSPCYIEKRGSKWHWQFIVKSKNRGALIEIIHSLPKNVIADIDPSHLL